MEDSQDFKGKTLKPIHTIEQLLASYLTAKAIYSLRNDIERTKKEAFKKSFPKLEIDMTLPMADKTMEVYEDLVEMFQYKTAIVYMLKFGMEDMYRYKFYESPSITVSAKMDNNHLSNRYKSLGADSYKILERVNLLEHTLDVLDFAKAEAERIGRISSTMLPLLACLFHDFGKSPLLRKEMDVDNAKTRGYKAHAEVSKGYIQSILSPKLDKILDNFPQESISIVSDFVENHHPDSSKKGLDQGLLFVINADYKARDFELKKEKIKEKRNKENA